MKWKLENYEFENVSFLYRKQQEKNICKKLPEIIYCILKLSDLVKKFQLAPYQRNWLFISVVKIYMHLDDLD